MKPTALVAAVALQHLAGIQEARAVADSAQRLTHPLLAEARLLREAPLELLAAVMAAAEAALVAQPTEERAAQGISAAAEVVVVPAVVQAHLQQEQVAQVATAMSSSSQCKENQ
jgi:hypothetical protein